MQQVRQLKQFFFGILMMGIVAGVFGLSGCTESSPTTVVSQGSNDTGLVWTVQNSEFSGFDQLFSVTWTGNQLVGLGARYSDTSQFTSSLIMTSSNATTWAIPSSAVITNASLNSVIWAGSQFVAVGVFYDSNTSLTFSFVMTSPTGAVWTPRTLQTSQALLSVTWTGTQLVAVGNSNAILTSADGITWRAQNPGISQLDLASVIWTGTQVVAVGSNADDSGGVLTSPDGIHWTQRAVTAAQGLSSVIMADSQLVAVGGATILTSKDKGVTWTNVLESNAVGQQPSIVFGDHTLIVTNYGNSMLISKDTGAIWTIAENPAYVGSLTWTGSQFVGVTQNSGIVTSP